ILIKNKPLYEIKSIISGFLVQEWDTAITDETEWKVVSDRKPDNDELDALRFAWKTVALLKSNAIAITTKENTIGLGIGQTSRVDSTEIALKKAKFFGHDLSKAVCASDGFFPFRDSIELLAKNGIKAIIQPGGSKGDDDVIRACDELNIALILTGKRHFKH
ncbi:MAG: bifunctional phosphoribosylaminoimidazolecarboxamide formyltransferase/IMP cyclohydrolase, partial [Candidatus Cloacimonetes bacterium]|nr:bifunctional phosphoribosylaminoimidazolecarboxamide formyltransferase/IMP cyclohydrolase [Candidatus Cloacimonadota bacterium]